MKNRSYVEALDKMIEDTKLRLEHLQIARGVLAEMKEVVAPAVQQEKPDGSITIRRVEGGTLTKEKVKPKRVVEMDTAKELQDWLTAELTAKPQISADLILSRFGEGASKPQKQTIYAGLYYMQQKGMAVRDEDTRVYTLVRAEPLLPDFVSEQTTNH